MSIVPGQLVTRTKIHFSLKKTFSSSHKSFKERSDNDFFRFSIDLESFSLFTVLTVAGCPVLDGGGHSKSGPVYSDVIDILLARLEFVRNGIIQIPVEETASICQFKVERHAGKVTARQNDTFGGRAVGIGVQGKRGKCIRAHDNLTVGLRRVESGEGLLVGQLHRHSGKFGICHAVAGFEREDYFRQLVHEVERH